MKCRCCESEFDSSAVLHFENMPASAQGFLEEGEMDADCGQELAVYQCPYCGLIQIAGKPVPYYRDVIRASAVSEEMKGFRLEYFREFVRKYELEGKKILEAGCGCGEFLELMNQAGALGYGIEHKRESVENCARKGLHVFEGFLDHPQTGLQEAPFDGFFIMNFLEHIPRPNIFLKAIGNNLAEHAVGLIEVPNVDMILKKNMFSEFIRDHLMYFTESTLRILLEKNGFEVADCQSVWHDYCLAATVKKKSAQDLNAFYLAMERMTAEINQYIDQIHSRNQNVAVWGAGHQALAVISLCRIADKISFVVDSADFKQGKYTPASHLKIVSPEELRNHNIGAVIVMAASFSDEVAGIIKNKFKGIEAVILRENRLEYV